MVMECVSNEESAWGDLINGHILRKKQYQASKRMDLLNFQKIECFMCAEGTRTLEKCFKRWKIIRQGR